MIFFRTAALLTLMILGGCVSNGIHESIQAHEAVRGQIQLGQNKSEVLAILAPAQGNLETRFAKQPEIYLHEGKTREIFFVRSRSFNDGIVTDDEFTPYVFENETLIAIGWTAIGGPKTQAQTKDDDTRIHLHGRYGYIW